ncbi:MAG TPA: MarR family transcriptional regulator [Polyangia bacterium]|nr:MarR family transcriptional regulator [Polyangia bacterium]
MATDEFDVLKLDNQICFPLYAASRLIVQAYRPHLDRLGITYVQYLTLMVLWEKDGSTVSQIGDRLALDSGTLTPVLKRLASDGLVERVRNDADDRVVENWLTRRGQALKRRAVGIPTQLLCSTSVELSEVGRLKKALAPVLAKLVAHQPALGAPERSPAGRRKRAHDATVE